MVDDPSWQRRRVGPDIKINHTGVDTVQNQSKLV